MTSQSRTAVDVTVTGRVQGVSFRMYAEEEAGRLGVAGWVRNEPDGSVAAHLEGEPGAVDAMVAWCRTGPPYARVVGVDVRPAEVTGVTGFTVRY
jgi:acylphosphatase